MKKLRVLLHFILLLNALLFPVVAQETQEAKPPWQDTFRDEFIALAKDGNISETTVRMFINLNTETLEDLGPEKAAQHMYLLAREIDLSIRRGQPRTKIITELHQRLSNTREIDIAALEETAEQIQKNKRNLILDQIKKGLKENQQHRGPSAASSAMERIGAAPGKPDIPFNK